MPVDRQSVAYRRRVIVLLLVAAIQLLAVSERLLANGQAPLADALSGWLSNTPCLAKSSGHSF